MGRWREMRDWGNPRSHLYKCGRVSLEVGAVLLALASCQTEAERKTAENARIEKQAATQIKRICALPKDQREGELKKIQDQSGVVLYCGDE